jgi:hypothetical protein
MKKNLYLIVYKKNKINQSKLIKNPNKKYLNKIVKTKNKINSLENLEMLGSLMKMSFFSK